MGSRKAWDRRTAAGLCKYCGINPPRLGSRTCRECLERRYVKYKGRPYSSAEKRKDYHRILRRFVIEKYGGECSVCKQKAWECLSIDHVNGDGGIERRKNKQSPHQFFLRLKREPKRDDLRVLCMSCNWSISHWGYSPLDPSRLIGKSFDQEMLDYGTKWGNPSRKRV